MYVYVIIRDNLRKTRGHPSVYGLTQVRITHKPRFALAFRVRIDTHYRPAD